MAKRGNFDYFPYYNYNPHPAYYRAARDSKIYGLFPQEEINRKFGFGERKSYQEVQKDLDDLNLYQREVLKDLGPDPRFAESDTKQEATGNLSRMKINVREFGNRYDKEPEHPEIFLGFTAQDPGGPTLNLAKMAKQSWDRRDIKEAQLSSDADNSLPSGGNLSRYGVELQKKQIYKNYKDRAKVFTTAKEGRITGLPYFGPQQIKSLKGKSCGDIADGTDRMLCGTLNEDRATNRLSNHVLSGNPFRQNYVPDHEFQVGPYGESMRRSRPLNDPAHNAARIKNDMLSIGFNDIGAKRLAVQKIAAVLNKDFSVLSMAQDGSTVNKEFKNYVKNKNVQSILDRIITDGIIKTADGNIKYKKGAICENMVISKDKVTDNHLYGGSEENEIFKSMHMEPKSESRMGRTTETMIKKLSPEKTVVYKNGKKYQVNDALTRITDNITYGDSNHSYNKKNKVYSNEDKKNMQTHNTQYGHSVNGVDMKRNFSKLDSQQAHLYNFDDTKFYDNYAKDRRVAHHSSVNVMNHLQQELPDEDNLELESTLF